MSRRYEFALENPSEDELWEAIRRQSKAAKLEAWAQEQAQKTNEDPEKSDDQVAMNFDAISSADVSEMDPLSAVFD